MSIAITCSSCKRKLKAQDNAAGRTLKCPQCGLSIQVPEETEAEAPAVPQEKRPVKKRARIVEDNEERGTSRDDDSTEDEKPSRTLLYLAIGGSCALILTVTIVMILVMGGRTNKKNADDENQAVQAVVPQGSKSGTNDPPSPPRQDIQKEEPKKKTADPIKPSITELIQAVSGPNREERLSAIKALAERGSEAMGAVDALALALADPTLRTEAAKALSSIGAAARRAVPNLYLNLDGTSEGSALLTTVLENIDKEAAKLYRQLKGLELDIAQKKSNIELLKARADTARVSGKAAELNDFNRQIAKASAELADLSDQVLIKVRSLSYWGTPGTPGTPAPAKEQNREKLLADLEMLETATQTKLNAIDEKCVTLIRELKAAEQTLLRHPGFGDSTNEKFTTDYNAFLKVQIEKAEPVIHHLATVWQKEVEFVQAKRRIMVSQPKAGDPILIEDEGLLLTEMELIQVKGWRKESPSPRVAADTEIRSFDKTGVIKRPVYVATWQDPENESLAVVSYNVTNYRGKAVKDQTIHLFLYKTRGYWILLRLDRPDVFLGPPPARYKRLDDKKAEGGKISP